MDSGGDNKSGTKPGMAKLPLEARSALLTFGLCGLAGILVDIDHLAALVLWRYWLPWVSEGRIFHTTLFIASCLAICGLGAHITRLYFRLILMGVIITTAAVLTLSPLVIWRW